MINKIYDPKSVEKRLYNYWLDNNLFSPTGEGVKFSIAIPPPNVTGILHIGHCLNNSIQDALIRYKKLKGFDTLWIPGLDHAGISTQQKVLQKIENEGKDLNSLTREEFLDEAWKWKEKFGNKILDQFKLLGLSLDWSRNTFTLDDNYKDAVKKVFMKLYDDGLIYKDSYIVNWSVKYETAISDDEVEFKDVERGIWHIKYDLKDGGHIVIATTRPETLLGDTAIAVNPYDERYKDLIGKKAILPIVGREIPIIGDDYVKPEFGTGALKVTPAHDPNDFEIGKRHNLKIINIFNKDLTLNNTYEGKTAEEARELILKDLGDRVLKEERHISPVGHCSRSKEPIESIVSEQWFVKMKPLTKKALDAVRNDEIKFYPEHWKKTYYHWLENIRDWCISRQLWWGHDIPIDNEVGDVLDTWFSSWLWPFVILGWPNSNQDLERYFPTDVVVTGPDIIFFWVARMIMSSEYFLDKIPFKEVIFNGIVRDEIGRKMSKTLGNYPDPIDVIDRYSADALRFALLYNHSLGNDLCYSESWVEMGSKFSNKLWNTFRFISSNLGDYKPKKDLSNLDDIDRWILTSLSALSKSVENHFENRNLDLALKDLYNFLWSEFADWYIELSKKDLKDSKSKLNVLSYVLNEYLKLLHPFMPFITEEIWQLLGFEDGISIFSSKYPEIDSYNTDIDIIKDSVRAIRSIRKDLNLSGELNCEIKIIRDGSYSKKGIEDLTKTKVEIVDNLSKQSSVYRATKNIELQIYVDSSDIEKERTRLENIIYKSEQELTKVNKTLSNQAFISSAKKEVIDKKREIAEEYTTKIEGAKKQLEGLRG